MCGPCCDYDRMKTDEILYIHTAKVVCRRRNKFFKQYKNFITKQTVFIASRMPNYQVCIPSVLYYLSMGGI